MKIFAPIALFATVMVLHTSAASADDITNLQCNTSVEDQIFNGRPTPCSSTYNAGDVSISRVCTYTDGSGQSQSCTTKWIESYLYSCADDSFLTQIDTLYYDTCPF
jgi:hypothetical protein